MSERRRIRLRWPLWSGYANGQPSVLVIIFRQPGANIIGTVDRIHAVLPEIQSAIPSAINVKVAMDQTVTIRASVRDTEETLVISVVLVILVVFIFPENTPRTVPFIRQRRRPRYARWWERSA